MSSYLELKNSFDHLQNRTMQLFEYGIRRENVLKTAVVNAWKQFGEIAEMKNICDIQKRALAAQQVMADVIRGE